MATKPIPFSTSSSRTVNGPLADLYSTSYNFEGLYYPRDLGSSARGHYINFYINIAENTHYLTSAGNGYQTGGSGGTVNSVGVLSSGGRTAITQQKQASAEPYTISAGVGAGLLTVRKTKRITQAIALYMPESVQVSYNASWQSESLTDALGDIGKYGGLIANAINKINPMSNKSSSGMTAQLAEVAADAGAFGSGANAKDFAIFASGSAINPQLEVLFKGTDMRTFSFDFLFAPFDAQEALNVMAIIKTFKFHQAPEVETGTAGRFFVPPSEFDIDFLFNGQINPNVHQIGTVVMTGMSVDYSPNGWSTFPDGTPTHIKLSLQFHETEIVTKQRVAKDNY